MKKLYIFTIRHFPKIPQKAGILAAPQSLFFISLGILFLVCGFQTHKVLAITPEIFAQTEVRQASPLNEVAILEKQAQQFYETGQFADTIAQLQRLVSYYATQGDKLYHFSKIMQQ